MHTLTNRKDTDEMPHNATFDRCLHCLLRLQRASEKKRQLYLESIICDPSMYLKWIIPSLLHQSKMKSLLVHNPHTSSGI